MTDMKQLIGLIFAFLPYIAIVAEYFMDGKSVMLGLLVIAFVIRFFINGSVKGAIGLQKPPSEINRWHNALAIWDWVMTGLAIVSFFV